MPILVRRRRHGPTGRRLGCTGAGRHPLRAEAGRQALGLRAHLGARRALRWQDPSHLTRACAEPPVPSREGRDRPPALGIDAVRVRLRLWPGRSRARSGRLYPHPARNRPPHGGALGLRRARGEHPGAGGRGTARRPVRPDLMRRPAPARALALAAPLGWDASALAWPALCAVAALAAVLPLWAGRFLPFQDAPQHLAAVRVLADYDVPAFAFRRWFEIDLFRSQNL